jgi:hypothetical protein
MLQLLSKRGNFVGQQDMWRMSKYNATMWHFNMFRKKENIFPDSYALLAF